MLNRKINFAFIVSRDASGVISHAGRSFDDKDALSTIAAKGVILSVVASWGAALVECEGLHYHVQFAS